MTTEERLAKMHEKCPSLVSLLKDSLIYETLQYSAVRDKVMGQKTLDTFLINIYEEGFSDGVATINYPTRS